MIPLPSFQTNDAIGHINNKSLLIKNTMINDLLKKLKAEISTSVIVRFFTRINFICIILRMHLSNSSSSNKI